MLDFALDEDFSVYLNGQNGIDTVTELAAFEQSVRVRVTDYFYRNVLGESDPEIAKQKIKLQIHRVADDHQFIDRVKSVRVVESLEESNSFEVTIEYQSEYVTQFLIN